MASLDLLTGRRPYEKSRSTASRPIVSWNALIRSSPSSAIAVPPKIVVKFSSAYVFQVVTWFRCTGWCAEISGTVFTPRMG